MQVEAWLKLGPTAQEGHVSVNTSLLGNRCTLSKSVELGPAKFVTERPGLGTGENVSQIKHLAFQLSGVASTQSPNTTDEAKAGSGL